ncbi:MAG: GNAT family N-acetyltransferase [Halodesulfurarchaeum sp.]
MPGPVFIEGDRVDLHTVEAEDVEPLQALVNDPRVRHNLATRLPINREQEEEWFEEHASSDEDVNLVIGVDGELAGTVGLHGVQSVDGSAEIGLFLDPAYWGEGYGTEASRLVTGYGFAELRLHRVVARVFEGNEASRAIWEKLGFRHEARHKEAAYIRGRYLDVHRYAILEGEWGEGREAEDEE